MQATFISHQLPTDSGAEHGRHVGSQPATGVVEGFLATYASAGKPHQSLRFQIYQRPKPSFVPSLRLLWQPDGHSYHLLLSMDVSHLWSQSSRFCSRQAAFHEHKHCRRCCQEYHPRNEGNAHRRSITTVVGNSSQICPIFLTDLSQGLYFTILWLA